MLIDVDVEFERLVESLRGEEDLVDAQFTLLVADLDESVRFEEALEWARDQMAEQGVGEKKKKVVRKPFFESALDLIGSEFPPQQWLVQGLVRPDGVVFIGAEPKAAKTWAALEICMAVATEQRLESFRRSGQKALRRTG